MKLTLLTCSLFSLTIYAVEPVPTPTDAGKEKVETIPSTGGALKVEKTPAHIEGINPTAAEKEMAKKGKKKKKAEKSEENM